MSHSRYFSLNLTQSVWQKACVESVIIVAIAPSECLKCSCTVNRNFITHGGLSGLLATLEGSVRFQEAPIPCGPLFQRMTVCGAASQRPASSSSIGWRGMLCQNSDEVDERLPTWEPLDVSGWNSAFPQDPKFKIR